MNKKTNIIYVAAIFIFCLQSFFASGQVIPKQHNKMLLSYKDPNKYEIAQIRVTGLETLNENALISLSGLRVGDFIKVPGEATSDAIKRLWENGVIGNVSIKLEKIENNKAYLLIELTERPRITKINILNVSKSQKSDIKEKINISLGRILTDATLKNTERSIRSYYIEKGFLNVEVKIRKEPDPSFNNGVQLYVDIDKKQKVKVGQVTIINNKKFSNAQIRSKLKKPKQKLKFWIVEDAAYEILNITPDKAKHLFTSSYPTSFKEIYSQLAERVNIGFFNSFKFNEEEYEESKNELVGFYNSKGHRDAFIEWDSIVRTKNDELALFIKVNEGTKYHFGDITWEGNHIHSDSSLTKILRIEKGEVYDLELLSRRLQMDPNELDISSIYMNNGYLFFRINPVETRVYKDTIDIEIQISEGPKTHINKVIVNGNSKTNDHVIIREIRTLPGQEFNRGRLMRTHRELAQLGFFDPETIDIQPVPNPITQTTDIIFNLEEKSNDQFELSGGWGGFYGFIGSAGVSFNNFSSKQLFNLKAWRPIPSGDGQRLSFRFQASGRNFYSFSTSFTEPWLGGKSATALTLAYNISNSSSTTAGVGRLKLSSYTVSVSKRLKWPDDYFYITNALSYSLYELFDYPFTTDVNNGLYNKFIYDITIGRRSEDNPIYPRSGSTISLNVGITPFYSAVNNLNYDEASFEEKFKWIEYHKWMFDASFFKQLIGDLVVNTRIHFGFMGTFSNKLGVGPFDRYQMGGSGLTGVGSFLLGYDLIGLRGYVDNSITPPYFSTGSSEDYTGGIAFNKYVCELRYPITLSQMASIYVLSFFEAGNNFHKISNYSPFDLYRSAGVGARIIMPALGIMGIDWAYGFDSTFGGLGIRSGSQFHFTIGQQIR